MKGKKITKIVVVALVASVLTQYATMITAFGATQNNSLSNSTNEISNQISTGKSNLVMLDNNLDHMQYTYDKNGKSYKAIENMNKTLDNGQTKI